MSDFLTTLSECLQLGGLDPSLTITSDGKIMMVDVSKIVVTDYTKVEAKIQKFLQDEENDPRVSQLRKENIDSYYDELNDFVGTEHQDKFGLNVVAYNKSVEEFIAVKTNVEEMEDNYKDILRTINFNQEWLVDERDAEMVDKLEKENKNLKKLAAAELDKIMKLKSK